MRVYSIPPNNPNPEATAFMLRSFADKLGPNSLNYQIGPDQYLTVMVGRLSMGNIVDRQMLLTVGRSAEAVFTGTLSTLELGNGQQEPRVYVSDAERGSCEVIQPPKTLGTEQAELLGVELQTAQFSDAQPLRTLHDRIMSAQYPEPWQLTFVTDSRPLFDV